LKSSEPFSSASFALTLEEQARSKQQASKQARDGKVSEPKEGDMTAGDSKDVDDKPVPVAIKPKNRTHQLVSLLDDKIKLDRLRREGRIDESKKLEATIRKRNLVID
jgi:hypothetical protein